MSDTFPFIWDEKHKRYSEAEWINQPTLFAQWVIQYFPLEGNILDVGCGQAQDARFFAERGYAVTGIDLSETGLQLARQKLPPQLQSRVHFERTNIAAPLLFADLSFDVVYSHLAIHYFDHGTTEEIFSELHRVLKPGGIIAVLVNSIHDPEYGTGEKIEDHYFKIGEFNKRFFSKESLSEFARKFQITVCDEEGETYKDRAVDTTNLVRLVGKKI